jgi:hypothetical protein
VAALTDQPGRTTPSPRSFGDVGGRRLVVLSAVLIGLDQLTKSLAQWLLTPTTTEQWGECRAVGIDCAARLADVRIATNWGVTCTEHAGYWLWGDLPLIAVRQFAVAAGRARVAGPLELLPRSKAGTANPRPVPSPRGSGIRRPGRRTGRATDPGVHLGHARCSSSVRNLLGRAP